MKYLFILLLLAFSLPAQAGFYGEFGLHLHEQLKPLPDEQSTLNGQPVTYKVMRKYDINYTANPYCSLGAGYRWHLHSVLNNRIDVALAFRHESSCATGQDKGVNEVGLVLRWGDQ